MKQTILLLLISAVSFHTFSQDKTYYINQNTPMNGGGSDANDGLSTATAWATINKANTMDFKAGDKILLYSDGPWHDGNIKFDLNDIGTPEKPITISSYGPNAKANVYAGNLYGVLADNTGSVAIKNINFYGGRSVNSTNNANGMVFLKAGTVNHSSYILIDGCRTEGFAKQGILIQSSHPDSNLPKGFSDITIKNSVMINCGMAGINIGATDTYNSNYVHKNILIENVRASYNAGVAGFTNYNTGNGIVVSSAENVLIDKCVADHNGANNSHVGGGISGIWFYDVKGGIIQNCESFNNYAGLDLDGNGFGIDGGSQDCIIQHCYSHDNEGAGFGMFEFGSANTFNNNTIRFNISQNDGRKNEFPGIMLWGVDGSHKVNNCNIYNNTIYLNAQNLRDANKLPVGVKLLTGNMSNVKITNNAFYLADAGLSFTKAIDVNQSPINVSPSQVLLLNNFYYNTSGIPNFNWGANYSSLAAWRTATSQEKYNSTDYGYTTDPGFKAPGSGTNVAANFNGSLSNQPVEFGGDLKMMTAYQLKANANAANTGIDLNTLFGLNIGLEDYYGTTLSTASFTVGASQYNSLLPLSALNTFNVIKTFAGNTITWTMYETKSTLKFEVEAKTNTSDFATIAGSILATDRLDYSFTDFSNEEVVYYRLKGTDRDGAIWYSAVRAVSNPLGNGLSLFPNPVTSNTSAIFNWNSSEIVDIKVYNTNGQIQLSKQVAVVAGNNKIALPELVRLPNSNYAVTISGSNQVYTQKIAK